MGRVYLAPVPTTKNTKIVHALLQNMICQKKKKKKKKTILANMSWKSTDKIKQSYSQKIILTKKFK